MAQIINNIRLSRTDSFELPVITAKQGDNLGDRIVISVYDDQTKLTLSEYSDITFYATKSDGSVIIYTTDSDYFNINTTDNTLILDLASEILAKSGTVKCEIVFTKSNSVKSTYDFQIYVFKNASTSDEVNKSDYSTIKDMVANIRQDASAIKELETDVVNEMKDAKEVADHILEYVDTVTKASENAAISASTAETSATNTKNSEDKALESALIATEKANNASASELNAQESASNAKTSEDNSKQSETNAGTSEKNAKASENNAKVSEDNALVSANNAETSATASDLSANNAKASEDNAKLSETNAKTSEENAKESEVYADASASSANLSASKAGESETNALTSANSASESATNALASASSAKASATASEASAVESAASADASATSASAAQASADDAQKSMVDAQKYASTTITESQKAATSATNASTSATNAETSATNADVSATNASNYADNAKASADEIKDWANISKSYAVGTDGEVRTDDNFDNAKYYYERARSISEGLGGSLLPMGTVTFATLPSLADVSTGYMYNLSDEFTTTSDFKEGSGLVIPAGSNVYVTADKMWDVLAGSPVVGIKGDNETEYRRGNVSLSSADIGAVDKEGDASDTYVVFEDTSDEDNIASGNTLSNMFAKIKNWFGRLHKVAFSGKYSDIEDAPEVATTETDGLMSADDKIKLDSLDDYKLIDSWTDVVSYSTNDVTLGNISTTDGDYSPIIESATTITSGVMSASDKIKLDGIATGATKSPISTSTSINNDTYAMSAKQLNASVSGTLANQIATNTSDIATLNNDLANKLNNSDIQAWAKANTKPTYTKSDVGLGNVENKSSATIRGELTKANVTTALGYTPPTTNTTYSVASTSANGLMSASDKSKLDGIASGANKYVLTKAAVTSALGYTPPTTNTTYSVASTSANGLMSASDKSKLDGIASGANKYVLTKAAVTSALGYTPPTSDTNTTYSAGTGLSLSGTTFSVKYGSASGTACQGNDSRLSNSRPASDVYSWAKAASKPTYTEFNTKTTLTGDPSVSNWLNARNCVMFYNKGELTNQPTNYGLLLNLVGSGNIQQFWSTQKEGVVYHRGANSGGFSGWYALTQSAPSSIKYKENIEPMTDEMAKHILKYNIVTFNYKDHDMGISQQGMIAEEVTEIDDIGIIKDGEGNPDSIDYTKFVPQLIKMVQLQQKEIDDLKAKLL